MDHVGTQQTGYLYREGGRNIMARFRCCGSATTEGHANDCSLKPPEATFEAREPEVKDEEGCQFDILQFRHIGECRGTCGGKEEGIRFADESGGELKILILMVDELSEEDIKELEKPGLKHVDILFCSCSNDLDGRFLHDICRGVDHPLISLFCYAHSSDWSSPGNVGYMDRYGCANKCEYIGFVYLIVR